MTLATNDVILASAGTGKTFALSSRYLRLLVDGENPANILATTFTRKAAGEILDRIIQRLADAALDESKATTLAGELDRRGSSAAVFGELLSGLTAQLNNLQVQTLDSFFAQLARSFSLDLGLPPDWEIADEHEMQRLQNYAIRFALTNRTTPGIIHDLGKGDAPRGISPMIRGMISNLYDIYRETVDDNRLHAWEVLTERAVLADMEIADLERRLQAASAHADGRMATALREGLESIAARDWETLIGKGLGRKISENDFTFYSEPILDELVEIIRPLVDHSIAIQINMLVRQTAAARRMLELFHDRFDRMKLEDATLRFDDINYLASHVLRNYSPGQFAFRLDKQIDHLLIDEFQDTSIEQWKVLEPIAQRTCSRDSRRSFFCVGDIKQAIYGWRGGVAEVFDDVFAKFGDSLERPAHLNKSWRSSPIVIELVNQTFMNIASLPQLKDRRNAYQSWCDKFVPHETERSELPGFATVETSDADQHLVFTANRIRSLAKKYPGKSIGVLARTNKQIAQLIFELGLVGVHASEEGGNPLTDSAAVNLVLSCLRLVDHPDDSAARFHVLHSPLGDLFGLSQDNWQIPDSPCRRVAQKFRTGIIDKGYGCVLREWARILDPWCTSREWFRLNQLVERGWRVSAAEHTRTADFITFVEQTRIPDPSTASVRVMTVHKSKGLEFDIVVLPFMDFYTGKAPAYIVGRDTPTGPIQAVCHYMSSVKQELMPEQMRRAFAREEESRIHEMLSVMYVAITRARCGLHIIANHKSSPSHMSAIGLIMGALKLKYDPKKSAGGKLLWSRGDPDWSSQFEACPDLDTPKLGKVEVVPSPNGPISFATAKSKRPRAWESPSSFEGGQQVELAKLIQLENNRESRIAGSLLHACFDQVGWLDDWIIDESVLQKRLRRVPGSNPLNIQNAIDEFKNLLDKPVLKSILRRNAYSAHAANGSLELRVETERPFTVRLGDRILNGSIDRLVTIGKNGVVQAAEIIDFKTDAFHGDVEDAVNRRTDIYRMQMNAYRDAVSRIYRIPLDKVTACLMYVAIDQHVQIV